MRFAACKSPLGSPAQKKMRRRLGAIEEATWGNGKTGNANAARTGGQYLFPQDIRIGMYLQWVLKADVEPAPLECEGPPSLFIDPQSLIRRLIAFDIE